MPKITPFLTINGRAEEAMNFYVSIFKNSKVIKIVRWGDVGPGPKGRVLMCSFTLDGQEFNALNDGPSDKFSPATSFVIHCETQEEVDHYWGKLSAGGKTKQCGWLDDKFGVTWQVTPNILLKKMSDPDLAIANRAMEAMIKMTKIIIKDLL